MIQWTSRICETCKYWRKDNNECFYHGNLDRTDKHGNDMIVIDCTCYEEGEPRCCSNCKHFGTGEDFCYRLPCYDFDKWEEKEK